MGGGSKEGEEGGEDMERGTKKRTSEKEERDGVAKR